MDGPGAPQKAGFLQTFLTMGRSNSIIGDLFENSPTDALLKTFARRLLSLGLLAFLMGTPLSAGWILKIGNTEIQTKEFQDYINLLRAQGGGEVVKAALRDVEDLNLLLQQYLDRKVLVLAAERSGYNKKNDNLNKIWEQQKDEMLLLFYLNAQVQSAGMPSISADEIKNFYTREVSKGGGKTWEQLADMERAQVQQLYVQQRQKKDYQDKLEKKFPVSRNKLDDFYVAKVAGTQIKLSEVDDKLTATLMQRGITKEALLRQNPGAYEGLRKDMREEMILRALLKLEMAGSGFAASAQGQSALDYLWEGFVLERYVEIEFKNRIAVSEKERDEEFNRNKEQLKNQPYDNVKNTLDAVIRDRKSQQRLPVFVSEKKEETPVRRNREELAKIQ